MLTQAQRDYLAGAPPADQQTEEIVKCHSDPAWVTARAEEGRQWMGLAHPLHVMSKAEQGQILAALPFTDAAQRDFLGTTLLLLGDGVPAPGGLRWGGGWVAGTRIIQLVASQTEGLIHEHTHCWWQDMLSQRPDLQQEFMAQGKAFADSWLYFLLDRFPGLWEKQKRVWRLARGYVYGDSGGFPGFLYPKVPGNPNCNEWYASLGSGIMGNAGLLPPGLSPFYAGIYTGG